MSRDYARLYVECAINDICVAHKRNNAMSKDEVTDLAERILRRKSHYSIEDLKIFADMVIGSELPSGPSGREEYELKAVDASAILSKLKSYEAMRNNIYARINAHEERDEEETRHPLTPDQLTHDYYGNDMTDVPGWNPEAYWYSRFPPEEEAKRFAELGAKLAGFAIDVNDNF